MHFGLLVDMAVASVRVNMVSAYYCFRMRSRHSLSDPEGNRPLSGERNHSTMAGPTGLGGCARARRPPTTPLPPQIAGRGEFGAHGGHRRERDTMQRGRYIQLAALAGALALAAWGSRPAPAAGIPGWSDKAF